MTWSFAMASRRRQRLADRVGPLRPDRQGVRFAVVAVVAAILVIAAVGAHLSGGSIAELLRDPAATEGHSVSLGALSHLGVLLWATSATVLLFAASISRGDDAQLAALLGAFTAYLGLDDLFLLHERVLPALGIPQEVVLAGYVVALGGIVARHRRTTLTTDDRILLMLAAVGFAVSLLLDVVIEVSSAVEDSAKFVALGAYLAFSLGWATRLVESRTRTGTAGE